MCPAPSTTWGLADRRCTWPGCNVPAAWAQIDHSIPWAAGRGATNVGTAPPMCGRHNLRKPRGYHTWRDAAGQWHHCRPDGTEIAPRGQSRRTGPPMACRID